MSLFEMFWFFAFIFIGIGWAAAIIRVNDPTLKVLSIIGMSALSILAIFSCCACQRSINQRAEQRTNNISIELGELGNEATVPNPQQLRITNINRENQTITFADSQNRIATIPASALLSRSRNN